MHEVYLRRLTTNRPAGENVEKEIAITHFPSVIGRLSECEQCLDLPFISRRHCCLFAPDDRIWVQDLGSRNGTYLNGQRVQGAQPIQDGDRLDLGHLAFQVRLRACPGVPTVEPGAVAEVPEATGQPQHVLVVEDNVDSAETLAMLLKGWGHNVEVAHDGLAAVKAARFHQPDTVLLDIRLPGMDGYQVAQQLRTQSGFEKTKLVAMTGHDQEKARCRSQEVGFDDLLTKPVDPDVLREVLSHSR